MGFSLAELEVEEVSVCVHTSPQMCPCEFEKCGDAPRGPATPLISSTGFSLIPSTQASLPNTPASLLPACWFLCLESWRRQPRLPHLGGSPCLGPLIREAFSNHHV